MKPWPRRDVLAYLDRVIGATSELNYFSLLDLFVTASEDDIQRAFHRVAGGIHPDRHRHLSAAQRERLTIVYARIAEAYRVLRDKTSREAYLTKLGKEHRASDGASSVPKEDRASLLSPKAQRLFTRGKLAARRGDDTSAVLNLKMALRLHPNSDVLKEALARLQNK